MEFLVSFYPLCATRAGRAAIEQYELAPFIDGSCRREPDLESAAPSVSATCRASRFVPRLNVGDRIAYITPKNSWFGQTERHWRLVAFLEVIETFADHQLAASWYLGRGLPVPSNCFVNGNAPVALDRTSLRAPSAVKQLARTNPALALSLWNASYRKRVRDTSKFAATQVLWKDTVNPRAIYEPDLRASFGRVPGTQTPPSFNHNEVSGLVAEVQTRT